VTGSQPELIARLAEHRTRPGYTPFEAMCLSQRVGNEFLSSEFFAADRFLVYYERHDCPQLNRLHLVPREELAAFLAERIRPERGEGADLTITTFEMAEFVLTSHDGDIWFRRPSEWPASEPRRAEPGAAAADGA
jgi:AcrR family transcriptional regulator